jgi:hypothetical protein
MNKPPDPVFRTIKVPLRKILKHYDEIIPKIEDMVLRINKFATVGYEFIKLYVLDQYENELELPKINKVFIKNVFSLLGQGSNKGRKSQIPQDLQEFYDEIFSEIYPDKINSIHLSYILPILIDEMIRCIETNTKTNFLKYLTRYINITLKNPKASEIKALNLPKEESKILYNQLYKEIREVKDDLINGKINKSDSKYHKFIKDLIKNVIPKINKSIVYDVVVSPDKYILSSIVINSKIEALEKKVYQIFPLRSNLVPKNITLNTSGIIEMINDKNKTIYSYGYSEMNNNAKKYQKHIWREILKVENDSIFKQPNYVFYNQIQTDGISASILFIKKEYADKTWGQKLPEYQEELKYNILTDLTTEQCQEYQDRNLIGIDPGKKDIFNMVSEDKTFYKYSNCRRRNDTYTKRSQQIINNEKKKNNITSIETKLSKCSKTSLKSEKFTDYLLEKASNNEELTDFYSRPLFRKLALRRYCRTKSSEDQMLNEIEQKYGPSETLLLGLGDWSVNSTSQQMRGCMPTPHKSLLKILQKRFEVVIVDEHRTSKLYNKDPSVELKNLKVRRGRKMKSIHQLLTPTRKPNGVILNRDRNACQNMLDILKEFLKHRTRPQAFCRQ